MTLDVLDFIAEKGGKPDAIKESQRRRGHSVELVDEVAKMYSDWTKSKYGFERTRLLIDQL